MEEKYVEFPKIARLSRECVVTEKIDGTNGLIEIRPYDSMCGVPGGIEVVTAEGRFDMLVGSRTQWIAPERDNYGFARWAYEHKDDLVKLGPGRHFGEWWGQGIGRKYGLTEKRFSLFSTLRWCAPDAEPRIIPCGDPTLPVEYQERAPSCCHVVPVLYSGPFDTAALNLMLAMIREEGSRAAPGFMKPEGIIVYHTAARTYFKKTIEKDEEWKGKAK